MGPGEWQDSFAVTVTLGIITSGPIWVDYADTQEQSCSGNFLSQFLWPATVQGRVNLDRNIQF